MTSSRRPPDPRGDDGRGSSAPVLVLVGVLVVATLAWLAYAYTSGDTVLTLMAAAVTVGVSATASWLVVGHMRQRSRSVDSQPRGGALRPTARGVMGLFTVPMLWIVGRAIGSTEILSIAAALGLAWIVSFVIALAAGHSVHLDRSAPAGEVFAGESLRITYRLQAKADWLWPVRSITERLGRIGNRPDLLAINGVVIGRPTAVQFEALPRGVFLLGPATVVRADPFGLFDRRVTSSTRHELRIWPRTVPLAGAFTASGLEDSGAFERAAREGTEFKGLREYVDGDDPRRIHWPSSAKRDVMLVRETQADVDARAIVVLDCRRGVYPDLPNPDAVTSPAFETAVSAAASAVAAFARLGWEVSLSLVQPAEGRCAIEGPAHLAAALDLLAGAELTGATDPTADGAIVRAVWDRFPRPAVGALVVATGAADAVLAGVLRRRSGQLSPRVVLTCIGGAGPTATATGPVTWVAPSDLADLPAAWTAAALRRTGSRRAARRRTTLGARR